MVEASHAVDAFVKHVTTEMDAAQRRDVLHSVTSFATAADAYARQHHRLKRVSKMRSLDFSAAYLRALQQADAGDDAGGDDAGGDDAGGDDDAALYAEVDDALYAEVDALYAEVDVSADAHDLVLA